MKKFFVISDVHSYLTPLKEALDAAGFDPTNNDHWLISCGDLFDRGDESRELLHYIMSIERKILVKGNHDILLEDLCMRGFPYSHDKSNGTVKTVLSIGDINVCDFDSLCMSTLNKTAAYRHSLINYFETKKYIFVHSWIPCNTDCDKGASKPWHIVDKTFSFREDWRNASEAEWEEAMWGNPFFKAQEGLNKTGKTIVFGHWHCSLGHLIDTDGELSEFGKDACWDIYKNSSWGIVGIDKCTAHTGKVNVLVLEDDFLEDLEVDQNESSGQD